MLTWWKIHQKLLQIWLMSRSKVVSSKKGKCKIKLLSSKGLFHKSKNTITKMCINCIFKPKVNRCLKKQSYKRTLVLKMERTEEVIYCLWVPYFNLLNSFINFDALFIQELLDWFSLFQDKINFIGLAPGVNPTKLWFLRFFWFSLLSLSVCRIRKYCLCFKMAKLNSEKHKKSSLYEEKSLVGLTLGYWSAQLFVEEFKSK